MTPYYAEDGITIYHGDCLDVLPRLGRFDLLLTDPPYGIGRDGKPPSTSSHGGHKGYPFLGWDAHAPDDSMLKRVMESTRDAVIWGGNYFPAALPASSGWLIWDKGQRLDQGDGELAFTTRSGPIRIFTLNRVSLMKDGASHPTQKPEALMQWCLTFFPDATTVLDPFMGVGTTLVAAKRLGKMAVGVDREECYCEVAATRLAQGVLPLEQTA